MKHTNTHTCTHAPWLSDLRGEDKGAGTPTHTHTPRTWVHICSTDSDGSDYLQQDSRQAIVVLLWISWPARPLQNRYQCPPSDSKNKLAPESQHRSKVKFSPNPDTQ